MLLAQFMLQLAPDNAFSVSYALGANGVRFMPFVLASVRWLETGVFARLCVWGKVTGTGCAIGAGVNRDEQRRPT